MCDDARNLASAGTDVRRCSDALGPRKIIHRQEKDQSISFRSPKLGEIAIPNPAARVGEENIFEIRL